MDDRIMVPAEQIGQLLVELADLLIDELHSSRNIFSSRR